MVKRRIGAVKNVPAQGRVLSESDFTDVGPFSSESDSGPESADAMPPVAVGIDLGTTLTCATVGGDKADFGGTAYLPSVIWEDEEAIARVYVGQVRS